MTNPPDDLNSRWADCKKRISGFENRSDEIIWSDNRKNKNAEKYAEPKEPVEQHQADLHMNNENPRKRWEREQRRKHIWIKNAKNIITL